MDEKEQNSVAIDTLIVNGYLKEAAKTCNIFIPSDVQKIIFLFYINIGIIDLYEITKKLLEKDMDHIKMTLKIKIIHSMFLKKHIWKYKFAVEC